MNRLLIANRGEIAVRIARTAHRLGIETVGVYSETDATAVHVDVVDRAVALGGTSPATSYLRIDAVVAAAVDTGCDAVHPGYGFLAENAAFARAVIDAGLCWVGPTPEQIELLGDKVAAKQAALAAAVPTTPIVEAAPDSIPDEIPLPALVKAAAGGGGRGMRIVRDRAELADAVTAAAREAESAFGDPTVFIEPYLERGRHIEVQIFGDTHGNVVHLGERECSIQRRNQKIVEEAPSAGIGDATRATLHRAAVDLARHVGYVGAGTVEFMVSGDGDDAVITFLEVNTRLQVEHPVTEAVTGFDLVEWQLRVADGASLPVAQDEIALDGHAIEVRLVAEDPGQGWIPSTGTLGLCRLGDGHVRVDSGIRAGSVVSADYDSMLAKLIAHGPNRAAAAGALARAVRATQVTGVATNAAVGAAILTEPDFLAADTPTSYLDEHPDVVTAGVTGDDELAALLAVVIVTDAAARAADRVTGFAPSGWRNLRTQGQRVTWHRTDRTAGPANDVDSAGGTDGGSDDSDGIVHTVEYQHHAATAGAPASLDVAVGSLPAIGDDGALAEDTRRRPTVRVFGDPTATDDHGDVRLGVEVDGVRRRVGVTFIGDAAHTVQAAGTASWSRQPRFVDHETDAAGAGPVSPLPGTVLSVHVAEGDTVAGGDLLVVVEAMKMEHKITAASDATVTAVNVGAGDRVDAGDLLLELAATEA